MLLGVFGLGVQASTSSWSMWSPEGEQNLGDGIPDFSVDQGVYYPNPVLKGIGVPDSRKWVHPCLQPQFLEKATQG